MSERRGFKAAGDCSPSSNQISDRTNEERGCVDDGFDLDAFGIRAIESLDRAFVRIAERSGPRTAAGPAIAESPRISAGSPGDSDDAVAIIGAGMNLPGGCTTLSQYWDVLINGIDVIRDIPDERSVDSNVLCRMVRDTRGIGRERTVILRSG